MRFPKTIKGYISLMRAIERDLFPGLIKGFDKLSSEDRGYLHQMDAEISNCINEVTAYPKEDHNE